MDGGEALSISKAVKREGGGGGERERAPVVKNVPFY